MSEANDILFAKLVQSIPQERHSLAWECYRKWKEVDPQNFLAQFLILLEVHTSFLGSVPEKIHNQIAQLDETKAWIRVQLESILKPKMEVIEKSAAANIQIVNNLDHVKKLSENLPNLMEETGETLSKKLDPKLKEFSDKLQSALSVHFSQIQAARNARIFAWFLSGLAIGSTVTCFFLFYLQ